MDSPHLDAYVDGLNGFDLPRPLRSGVAIAAVGLLPLALGLADVIRPLSGLVFAAIFVAVGALRWLLAHVELVGIRRRADLELRREPRPYLLSSFAQWRASELTSDRHRLALARAVARTERDLSPAVLPGASPLNRVAARPHIGLFRQLAKRLAALDRQVTAQAVRDVEVATTGSDRLESRMAVADDDKRPSRREARSSSLACSEGQMTLLHPLSTQSALLQAAAKVRS